MLLIAIGEIIVSDHNFILRSSFNLQQNAHVESRIQKQKIKTIIRMGTQKSINIVKDPWLPIKLNLENVQFFKFLFSAYTTLLHNIYHCLGSVVTTVLLYNIPISSSLITLWTFCWVSYDNTKIVQFFF